MVAAARVRIQKNAAGATKVSLRFFSSSEVVKEYRDADRRALLSIVPNSKERPDKPQRGAEVRAGFGRLPQVTVFTKLAKETVQEAAAVLEHYYDRRVLFFTATLPGSTQAALRAISEWSGYLVERFKQWLSDNCHKWEGVGVWERQKRGALHLHWAVGGLNEAERAWFAANFQQWWCHALRVVSAKAGVDLFERESGGTWQLDPSKVRANAVPVQKSISRYLAKYLSKNRIARNNWTHAANGREVFFPSRWWGISNSLRHKVRAERRAVESELLPVDVAADIVEGAWAIIAAVSPTVFSWTNPYRERDRTLIGFPVGDDPDALWWALEPIRAALRVAQLSANLDKSLLWVA